MKVPVVEPPAWAAHREGKGKAPGTGDAGTVYAKAKKSGDGGPTSKELELATTAWLKANKPDALDSKVERVLREHGWRIVWTPPYCP